MRETDDPREVGRGCDVVVATTSAHRPLLHAGDLRARAHVNAMGSDTPDKQELDAALVASASRVVVDSRAQAALRGEAHKAVAAGLLDPARIEEIGEIVLGRAPGRRADDGITIFDSTGLAVQDIAIAAAVAAAAA